MSEGDRSRPADAVTDEEPDDSESSVSDFGITARHAAVTHPRPSPVDEAALTDPRFAVAAELRRMTTALVGRPIPDDALREAAVSLAAVAAHMEGAAGPGRRQRLQPDPEGHPQDFFPTSPVIGFANPVAPPVKVEVAEGGGLAGTAFFDYPYEGPPTCVHGGVIAMVFDELLGAANIAAGCPGMTGTLTIRYRKPTPLRTELRLEARCIGRQGRKVTTWGGISHGEELLAEAEGIFIELVPERFLEVVTAHAGDLPPGFTP